MSLMWAKRNVATLHSITTQGSFRLRRLTITRPMCSKTKTPSQRWTVLLIGGFHDASFRDLHEVWRCCQVTRSFFQQVVEHMTKVLTASAPCAMKNKVVRFFLLSRSWMRMKPWSVRPALLCWLPSLMYLTCLIVCLRQGIFLRVVFWGPNYFE